MQIKKLMTVLSVLCMVFGLQACSKPDDATISENVKTKILSENLLSTTNIKVSTRDGLVTLDGTVDSDLQKQMAIKLAQGVDGVKNVESHLIIRAVSSTQSDSSNMPQASPAAMPSTIPSSPETQSAQPQTTPDMSQPTPPGQPETVPSVPKPADTSPTPPPASLPTPDSQPGSSSSRPGTPVLPSPEVPRATQPQPQAAADPTEKASTTIQ